MPSMLQHYGSWLTEEEGRELEGHLDTLHSSAPLHEKQKADAALSALIAKADAARERAQAIDTRAGGDPQGLRAEPESAVGRQAEAPETLEAIARDAIEILSCAAEAWFEHTGEEDEVLTCLANRFRAALTGQSEERS